MSLQQKESLQQTLARLGAMAELAEEKTSVFRGQLFGPSGGGKTTIAAMIMRTLIDVINTDDRIIHFDTSEGYVSWRNIPGLNKGIITIPFTSLEDIEAIVDGINLGIEPWSHIKGVILDEGSVMIEQDTFKSLADRHEGIYGQRLQDEAGELTDGTDSRITLERYRRIAYKLYDNRNLHVIITAHQREKKDKRGNIVNVSPDFSPRIQETVKRPLHLSAHITGTTRNDLSNPGVAVYTRVAQVHPTIMVDAKCRLNIFETAIDAETLPSRIKDWLDAGGKQLKAEDVPREVEVHAELQTEVDESEPEISSLEDVSIDEMIEPINK